MKHSKIAIIGAGSVGSTTAYALLLKKITSEIILIDINESHCHGEILDLSDALFFNGTSQIKMGTHHDVAHADIIIIAAGKPQNPQETRQALFTTNKNIIKNICHAIQPINQQAIIIVVTNPLDPLTALVQSLVNLPQNQIFGTGTFLDTLRLRGIISQYLHIAPISVDAYVLGEHGDSQCIAWSSATIAGIPITQFPKMTKENLKKFTEQTKNKAYEIIACKGSTNFGIAACIATICEAIIFNQRIIIPLSTYIKEYNTYFSMPTILGENGIEQILHIPLNNYEQEQLEYSSQQVNQLLNTN